MFRSCSVGEQVQRRCGRWGLAARGGRVVIVPPCFQRAEKLTDQVMQNPQVLAALQERLDSVSHTPSSYIET